MYAQHLATHCFFYLSFFLVTNTVNIVITVIIIIITFVVISLINAQAIFKKMTQLLRNDYKPVRNTIQNLHNVICL